MNTSNAINAAHVMDNEDLDLVAGGRFSLNGYLGAMAGGAVAGAVVGGLTSGNLAGAANGAINGAAAGGIAYAVTAMLEQ